MLALALYDAQCCPGCGFHESVTSDPSKTLMPEPTVCTVCAGSAQYGRKVAADDAEADKQLGEHAKPETPRAADGRRIGLRLLSADEARRELDRRAQARAQTRIRRAGGGANGDSPRTRRPRARRQVHDGDG